MLTTADPYNFRNELLVLKELIAPYALNQNEHNLVINSFKHIMLYNHISGEPVFHQYLQGLIYDSLNSLVSIFSGKERYFHLNIRSLVENIARIVLKKQQTDDVFSDFIRSEDFAFLKAKSQNVIWNYLHQIYSTACLYVHSSPSANLNVTHTFEQLMKDDTCTDRMTQIKKLQQTLNYVTTLLIINFNTEISDVFIRTRRELKFLIGNSLFKMYEKELLAYS